MDASSLPSMARMSRSSWSRRTKRCSRSSSFSLERGKKTKRRDKQTGSPSSSNRNDPSSFPKRETGHSSHPSDVPICILRFLPRESYKGSFKGSFEESIKESDLVLENPLRTPEHLPSLSNPTERPQKSISNSQASFKHLSSILPPL